MVWKATANFVLYMKDNNDFVHRIFRPTTTYSERISGAASKFNIIYGSLLMVN